MTEANAERDSALLAKAKLIEDRCVVVKEAEHAARITECQHLSINAHNIKVRTQSSHQKYLIF